MEIKSVVLKIAEELNREIRPINIGILNADGTFIASNFSSNSIDPISQIVKQYASIPINNYIKQGLPQSNYFLYIYKISTNIFIVCITDTPENLVLKNFGQIARDYGNILLDTLQPAPIKPKKIPEDDRIVAVVFSKAGDLGPSAINWMPKSLKDQTCFEVAAKSLLILSAGFDRTPNMKESSSVLPFPWGIGMVFVFAIPDPNARGESFDAAITIILREEYRKALLERLDLFEKTAKAVAAKIQGGADATGLVEQFYEYISNTLDKKVEAFTSPQAQQVIPADHKLKLAMVDEIKRIQVEHPKSLDLDFSHRPKKRKY